jgi:hypothetical protein
MNAPRRLRDYALVCALLLGILADQLIRVPGRPGLNVALWAAAGVIVLSLLSRRRDVPFSTESRWLVGGALVFAVLLTLRDAEALAVFCLFSAIALLGLAAGRAAFAWAARMNFTELAASAVRVGGLIALGPLGWSLGPAREEAPVTHERVWPQRLKTAARGTVMALPPLLVLTALLTSADPVFEQVLQIALLDSFRPMLEHLAFAALIAWFTSGFLRAFMVNDDVVMKRVHIPRPGLAPSEVTISLSLLNLLFLVFLIVQVRYLFGGASLVEVTPGLSYADYARRGFFELVAAAALVIPVLLVADWAAADEKRSRYALRATSTLLVLLLVGVLASAAYRLWLYQGAYGLTEDRLHGSVFMVWLIGVLGWLALTVLRGKRRGFAFGAIVGGLACVVTLHVLNPHALIARVNISRATQGGQYDGKYLSTLSADAVPTLIERMPTLPRAERCQVAEMLQKRWSGEREGGWRTWNFSDASARARVAELRTPAECGS